MSILYEYKVAVRHLLRLAITDVQVLWARLRGMQHVWFQRSDGLQMRVRTNDLVGRRMMREYDFEPTVRAYVGSRQLCGETVVDVGANIGYFTLQFAKLAGSNGKVIAFEPTVGAFAELLANVEANALRNTICHQLALSDRSGTVELNIPGESNEAYASIIAAGTCFGVRQNVECRTFDELWHDLGEPRVALVKMDIEGAERLVLCGARRALASGMITEWIFEANEPRLNAHGECVWDILSLLAAAGYQIRQLAEDFWSARLGRRPAGS